MLIHVVNHNAEQTLLKQVEESNHSHTSWGAVHFACSKTTIPINEEGLLLAIRPLVGDRNATLYLFGDGDIAITFHSAQSAILKALTEALYAHFNVSASQQLHRYFDSQAQGEELRLLCKNKLVQPVVKMASDKPAISSLLSNQLPPPSDKQLSDFRLALKGRAVRKQLEILIVEDQPFSATLLAGLLDKIAKTAIAPNAEKAMELYLEHAPDIAFLDVEMLGMNGHELAAALHQIDPGAYIVMVTANNYIEDVNRAKTNGAKGFVAKPYSKQKILEHVEKYIHERKLKS